MSQRSDESFVNCVGHGKQNDGCGLVRGESGGVCKTCGGMLLSDEALELAMLVCKEMTGTKSEGGEG